MADKANQPDKDMKKLKERFTQDLEVARKYMQPIHQLMDKYYEMYRNRWSENETDFQISDLFAYVETVVPILTNNRTRSRVKAEYPDYVKHAEGMTFILDNTFDVNLWDYMAQDIARKAEIYRSAIAYTGYDTDAKNGTGALCIKDINIRWCYLDPAATDLQDSSFFFYVEPKRLSQVVKMYPSKAQEIRDAVGKRDAQSGMANQNKSGQWFQSWVRTIKNAVSFNSDKKSMQRLTEFQFTPEMDEDEKRKNSVAFIHYWYRDDEDKWRCSYWADDVPLEDIANPFAHEMLPYDIYSPTKDILSSMGVPMAEHIENLNYEKNVIMDMIVNAGKRAVDPVLLYNTTAGIKDPKKMRTQARDEGVVGINNPDMVPLNALAEFFTPPPLPAYADNLPERFSAMEDRITGVNDSFRGLSDATSGKEVQLKQEAAYTRIKTKVDNWELFVTRISNKIIVNAMQFCKETRAYRVKGDYTKYANAGEGDMPFDVKPIPIGTDAQGQPMHDRKEFFLYANPNEWTKEQPGEQDAEGGADDAAEGEDRSTSSVQAAFRVLQMTAEIEAGSSLPTSPIARKEEASELFKEGAIDQQALLEAYDYPDREAILQRMQQAAQQQQQAQQQQMQMEAQMKQPAPRSPAESISFKDLPPEGQVQLAAQAGIRLTPDMIVGHQARTAQIQAASQPQPAGPQGSAQPQQQPPDVAGGLDAIRKAVPELANVSDQQLMAMIAQMPQPA